MPEAREGGPEGPRLLRRREGGARPRAARVARPPRRVPLDRASRTASPRRTTSGPTASTSNVKKLSEEEREKMEKDLRKTFESDITDTEAYIEDAAERIRQVWDLFREMKPKDIVPDETVFRELKDRFGSPYGFGEYFRGGMGAEADPRPAPAGRPRRRARGARGAGHDLEGPEADTRGQAPEGRVGVPELRQQARAHDPRGRPGDPAGAAPDGPARRRPLRDLGPERPLPPRHQPQQPPEAAARPRRARDHRQQREADAPGGRRRAVRQRPPRAPRHGPRQPRAQVAVRHAEGQAGPVPPEPARQARRLLGPLGDRVRARRCGCTSAACRS